MNMTHDFPAPPASEAPSPMIFVRGLTDAANISMIHGEYAKAVIDAVDNQLFSLRQHIKDHPDLPRSTLIDGPEFEQLSTLLMLAKDQCERAYAAAEKIADAYWPE